MLRSLAKQRVPLCSRYQGSLSSLYEQRFFGSDNRNPRNSNHRPRKHTSNKKQNFDAKFGDPKKKYPKLAARKGHVSLNPSKKRGPVVFDDDWPASLGVGDLDEYQTVSSSDAYDPLAPGRVEDDYFDDYYDVSMINESKYFWSEEEVEEIIQPIDDDMLPPEGEPFLYEYLASDRLPSSGEEINDEQVGLDDGISYLLDDDEEPEQVKPRPRTAFGEEDPDAADPEEDFFVNQFDLLTAAAMPESAFPSTLPEPSPAKVLPLEQRGPGLDGFLEAMTNHPSEYARVECNFSHADSLREPKPVFDSNRRQPPLEFVEKYKRFLYITGLPETTVNGEPVDLDNKVQFSYMVKEIQRYVNATTDHIYPVSLTSAFIGYDSPRALSEALKAGIQEGKRDGTVVEPVLQALSDTSEVDKNEPTLKISTLPHGHSPVSLKNDLFGRGSEAIAGYEDIEPKNIRFLSKSSAIIKFSSPEQADSAASSSLLRGNLKKIGTYRPRLLRARRELVHQGFVNGDEMRKQGPRLVVDSEMPAKDFYVSHARVILLSNVDPNLSKEDISTFFQPFCEMRRDVEGSIDFVRCEAGEPTGQAYVGFELPGEAEACMRVLKGRFQLGERHAVAKLCSDRRVPNRPYQAPEKRPLRTEAQLLQELNDWERFVDPKDVAEILASGISKDILDEALRGFRYKNASFGPLDSGLRGEALQPERETGELYKEFVQTYIKTLKECIPTREDPGEMFELMHGPDQPLDFSFFDDDIERQEELRKRRENPIL